MNNHGCCLATGLIVLTCHREKAGVIESIPKKEIYRLLSEKDDIGLIRCMDEKADERWVRFIDLQNQGRLIGEIKTALPISILENQLFFWDQNSVIVQPLKKISDL